MTRQQRVEQVMADVLARRQSGEDVTLPQIVAEYPGLQPELTQAIRFAAALPKSHGRMLEPAPFETERETLEPLTDAELDAPLPLSVTGDGSAAPVEDDAPPALPGFVIVGEIGRGGQAVVYEAVQQSTRQQVAIKVLPGGRFAAPTARARFDREASILARLNHPDIVGIIDRGRTVDGFDYIVMPFVDGPTLDGHLAAGDGNRTLPVVLKLFANLARAVGTAHALDIVHRDLKPSNVRVDAHGHARVLDFGLARLLGGSALLGVTELTMTADRQIVGSLPYASPEQLRGDRELSAQSDVYGLGLMLYEAVAGEPAYRRDVPMPELVKNILHYEPRRPSGRLRRLPGVDGSLDAVLAKCLKKSPADRYADATALAIDLEAILAGRHIGPALSGRTALLIAGILIVASASFFTHQLLSSSLFPPTYKKVSLYPLVQLKTMTNSVGMTLLLIPVGSSDSDASPFTPSSERAAGNYTLLNSHAFWLGETEVTTAQYNRVMGLPPAPAAVADLPVTHVSWFDAQSFCQRLTALDYRTYQLPSHDQWEYACRAGAKAGADHSSAELNQEAWYLADSGLKLHPVARLRCGTWGLFDMLGNAAEWCDEISKWDGKTKSATVCGGSYTSPRSATQSYSHFSVQCDVKSPEIGFRVSAVEP